MYFFEQLLYEAAPPQIAPPVPKPVTYAPAKKVLQAQAAAAQEQQMQQQAQSSPQPSPQQSPSSQQSPSPSQEDDFNMDDFSDEDLGDEDGTGDISEDPNTSLIPIKRYYLIQKLFALYDKLNELRIKNDVLNLVISFIDSFTYESLLSLSSKLVEDIYLQVKDTKETT